MTGFASEQDTPEPNFEIRANLFIPWILVRPEPFSENRSLSPTEVDGDKLSSYELGVCCRSDLFTQPLDRRLYIFLAVAFDREYTIPVTLL
jgi:hypothetical protein